MQACLIPRGLLHILFDWRLQVDRLQADARFKPRQAPQPAWYQIQNGLMSRLPIMMMPFHIVVKPYSWQAQVEKVTL
jgi:hypothetical protein